MSYDESIKKSISLIKKSQHITAFTGAGISVESGIPPFRGKNGLWNKFDPIFLDKNYFYLNPAESWKLIKEIFYDFFGKAKPNKAHFGLAKLEKKDLLNNIITQNIDNLHQKAGSKNVLEFHGTSARLICNRCKNIIIPNQKIFENLPPLCPLCNGLLKPDFVFFGEGIPEPTRSLSFREAEIADLFIVIGTTGEIQPASSIPIIAKARGVKIIEINIEETNFTRSISDIFVKERATQAISDIVAELL